MGSYIYFYRIANSVKLKFHRAELFDSNKNLSNLQTLILYVVYCVREVALNGLMSLSLLLRATSRLLQLERNNGKEVAYIANRRNIVNKIK